MYVFCVGYSSGNFVSDFSDSQELITLDGECMGWNRSTCVPRLGIIHQAVNFYLCFDFMIPSKIDVHIILLLVKYIQVKISVDLCFS